MQFTFPSLPSERFTTCQSAAHLNQLIRKELMDMGLERKCKYKVSHRTVKMLYANCHFCDASLSYRLQVDPQGNHDNDEYILIRSKTKHIHPELAANATKKERMISYLRNLPPQVEPTSIRKLALKELGTSNFTFYQALRDMEGYCRGVAFRTLLPYLEEKGYIVYEPFPVEKVKFFPHFCLFISPGMKKKYLDFGRFISVDFTYNLIREKPYVSQEQAQQLGYKNKKPKQWITGIISGLDGARRLLVYAIAFCYSETADVIEKLLDNFFDIMGQPCETILSDGGLGIEEAIKKLKNRRVFEGTHLLDAYHIMANLKVKYHNCSVLRRLYLAADQEEYYSIYQSEVPYMEPAEQAKMGKFEALSHRCCISKVPQTFVGLGASTCSSEKINDLIKTAIPNQSSISEVFTKLIRLSEKINDNPPDIVYETYPFQNIILLSGIREIRSMLNRHVFQRLAREIFKATGEEYNACRSRCQQSESSNKWQCSCKFQEKTGLPCRHIIKILTILRIPIGRQIDEYWIQTGIQQKQKRMHQVKTKGIKKIKRGRPRISRRNMKK